MFIKFDKSATCLSAQDKAAKKKPAENEEAAKADFARMISEKKNGMARAAVSGGSRECTSSSKAYARDDKNNDAASTKKNPREGAPKERGAGSNAGVKKETATPTSRSQVRDGGNKESAVSSQSLGEEGGKKEPAASTRAPEGRDDKKKNTFTSQTLGEEGGKDRTFSTIVGEAGGNNGSFTTAALNEEGGKGQTFSTQPLAEEGGKDQTFAARYAPPDDSKAPTAPDLQPINLGATRSLASQLLGEDGEKDEDDEDDDDDVFPSKPVGVTSMALGEEGGKKNGLG